MRLRSWGGIAFLAGLLILVGVRAVHTQAPASPPLADYLLTWSPAHPGHTCLEAEGLQGCTVTQPRSACRSSSVPCSQPLALPEPLRGLLSDLQAQGELQILELIPEAHVVHLLAGGGAAAQLEASPQVARLERLWTGSGSPGQSSTPTPHPSPIVTSAPPPVCATPTPPFPPTPIPPAEPEWTIDGTVYDSAGTPLEGVYVSTGWPWGYYAADYTAADGQYSLDVVAGTYRVEAHWSGRPGSPSRVVSVPPSQSGMDLTFPPFYDVAGTVRDHEGLPLEAIEVRAGGTHTATNAAGQYVLHLEAGNYCATVNTHERPASPSAQTVRVPPGQSGIDFTYPHDYEVSGAVLDFDGVPIFGAWVYTRPDDPWYAEDWSDADGQYALYLVTGTYTLVAFVMDHAYTAQAGVSVPPDRPGTNLAFPPGYSISGTVRDAGGLPLQGASVSICPSGGGGMCAVDLTDAEGHYRLLGLAGTWRVHAEKWPLPSPPDQTVTVPPDQVVDLTFPPPKGGLEATSAYTITGSVRDSQGDPVHNAWIGAGLADCGWASRACTSPTGAYTMTVEEAGTYFVRSGGEVRLATVPPAASGVDLTWYAVEGSVRDELGQPVAWALVSTRCGSQDCSAFSDVEGHYRLYVPPGTYQVTARHSGYPQPAPQSVSAPPGAAGLDFVLPFGHAISGVVLNGDGVPLEGAAVLAIGEAGSAGAESDACGIYALWMAAGTYTVTVSLEGYTSPPPQTVSLPPDVYSLDWTIEPEPPPELYTISGTVWDSEGTPVEGAAVCADQVCTTTDAEGTYQLEQPAGTYEVEAWKEGYGKPSTQMVTVPPDQSGVDFTLPVLYLVTGTVRDAAGQPLDAQVFAREPTCGHTISAAFQIKDSSVYTLALEAGTYEVSAVPFPSSNGDYSSEVVSLTVPPAAQGVDLTIPLPVRYTLSGIVHDGSGTLLPATVSAGACGRPGSVTSTASGLYGLNVPAGTWLLSAEADIEGYQVRQRIVTVAGDRPGLDLMLEPAEPPCCAVYGLVVDDEGHPLKAEVQVADGPGDGQAQAASCGLYRLPLDTPGSYTLRAVRTGYETVTQTVTVAAAATWLEWTLPVRPVVAQISGTLRDAAGRPLAWSVGIHGLDEFYEETVWSDTAGGYARSVPAGRYRVEAEAYPCYTDRPAQEVTVPPSAVVDLTFGHHLAQRVSGRVTGPWSRPVYGAVLSAVGDYGSATAASDSNGNYRLRLSPGTWSLSAAPPPLCFLSRPPARWVTVPPDVGIDWRFLGRIHLPLIVSVRP